MDGALIILAYPEEFVAMIPGWYKKPLEWINLVQDGVICAGHSACILIDKNTGILEYTDFGRYTAPFGKGRARTFLSDPDVEMDPKAEFDRHGNITNLEEIQNYIYRHPEKTHGSGTLYSSINYRVDYNKTKGFIRSMNDKGSIRYGPFLRTGTNCSRYVKDVILNGAQSRMVKRRLRWISALTASPLGNVFYGADGGPILKMTDEGIESYLPSRIKDIWRHLFLKFNGEFPEPQRVEQENGFQWLGGVGAGSWFRLDEINEASYELTRLRGNGEFVFSKKLELTEEGFAIGRPYRFIYDTHARLATIYQESKSYTFKA